MEEPAVNRLRAELMAVLAANTDPLRQALRAELDKPIALDADQWLQFEIDPFFFGISSCATEDVVMPGDWLEAALPKDWFERAEVSLGGWNELISEVLCPWFAECWQFVGGPARFSLATLFFHDYHYDQYDLVQRRWESASKEFGE
jgi:hypothetical protein